MIPATGAQSLAFTLFRLNAYPISFINVSPCFIARLCVQLRGTSSYTFKTLQLQPFLHETRYSCLPQNPCSTVLSSFELRCCCQDRDCDIYKIATEMLMGPVRVLSCGPR